MFFPLKRTVFRKIKSLSSIFEEIYQDNLSNSVGISDQLTFSGNDILIEVPDSATIRGGTALHGDTYIHAQGGLKIGKYVHIGRGLTIFTSNHNYLSENYIPYDNEILKQPVLIEDFVWIGANVSIIPGITIEEGAIVGLGAVVVKDVPKYAIVGGNPAEVLGYRDVDHFEKLKSERKFF